MARRVLQTFAIIIATIISVFLSVAKIPTLDTVLYCLAAGLAYAFVMILTLALSQQSYYLRCCIARINNFFLSFFSAIIVTSLILEGSLKLNRVYAVDFPYAVLLFVLGAGFYYGITRYLIQQLKEA